MVKPTNKKLVISQLRQSHQLSERTACNLVGLSRNGYRYKAKISSDELLTKRIKTLAVKYPRYGYLLLHALLKTEGLVINKKQTYRLYRQENLQVRIKKRNKIQRDREPMEIPKQVNERWSMDFVSDQLSYGRRFRILNIVDDCTRELVGQFVSTSITGNQVASFLNQISEQRPLPKKIICDNGPEFTSKALFFFSQERQVQLGFIQPGKPTQNAFVESFNGKFRNECLNQHWFRTLEEARRIINQWRTHYNTVRPHSSLGYLPPVVFAQKVA